MSNERLKMYFLKAREDLTCLAKTRANSQLDAKVGFKTVLSQGKKDEKSLGWSLYIEDVDKKNRYAAVKSIRDSDGKEILTDEEAMNLICKEDYLIDNLVRKGQDIEGQLSFVMSEVAQVATEGTSDDIQSLADQKVKDGIIPEEEAKAILDYLAENHIDAYLMKRIVSNWRKHTYPCKLPKHPSTKYVDPDLAEEVKDGRETIVSQVLRCMTPNLHTAPSDKKGLKRAVRRIRNLLLEGEKSTGKNVLFETALWCMWESMYLQTLSNSMSGADLYGSRTTDNSASEALKDFDSSILAKAAFYRSLMEGSIRTLLSSGMSVNQAAETIRKQITDHDAKIKDASDGDKILELFQMEAMFKKASAQAQSVNIVFDTSELVEWLTNGGGFVLNEMNMANANFLSSFVNQLLDGTGFLFVPGRGEIPINPHCVLLATQNADYEGTQQQSEAVMSRFDVITVGQPKSIEGQLKAAVHAALEEDGCPELDLSAEYYSQCQKLYAEWRKAMFSTKADRVMISNACLNIRGFVRALTRVAESRGCSRLSTNIISGVVNGCPVDERPTLAGFVNNIITL